MSSYTAIKFNGCNGEKDLPEPPKVRCLCDSGGPNLREQMPSGKCDQNTCPPSSSTEAFSAICAPGEKRRDEKTKCESTSQVPMEDKEAASLL
ncbi:hypothetical protein DNTS_028164 [Danionella cerebrum]|uniref:Uncharacterized protein n=1 Tax=Danionella cerebrum TaxID=2873325 RepID=A0A553QRR0_9TELE|nr:hypothetical protein DNTS_028164 [Danionella translucida]